MTSNVGGALHSDHVNYLIFRYLQEAGHEDTATAFHRDWHRSSEYRDPENYPWAQTVRRNELVSIIQSGLHHDELEARVKKGGRKFQFAYVNARGEGVERGGVAGFENGMVVGPGAGSRPGSSAAGKRKGGRPTSVVRPVDDFPTPAPKRQRRSEGSEAAHLNGDAMDVDAASPSAEADEDGDAVSPAVASEPEMTDVPERYDSMDVAVQTEVKAAPKTTTMYWEIDKPDAVIFHAAFNPSADSDNVNAYLTVGESLCRFYKVPPGAESGQQILSVDEASIPADCVVTASAWHPNGRAFVLAVDSIRELSDERKPSRSMILSHEADMGLTISYQLPSLLVPHGIVLVIRYSPDASKLLILQTNIKRAVALVYQIPEASENAYENENATLLAWRIFEHQVLDAQWVDLDGFVVAGNNGLADGCFLDPTGPRPSLEENVGVNEMTILGLINPVLWLPENSPVRPYDRVRVSASRAIALVSSANGAEKKLIAAQGQTGTHSIEFGAELDLKHTITALAWQPEPDADASQPRFLAAAFEEGGCVVYSYFHAQTKAHEEADKAQGEPAPATGRNHELKELLSFYLAEGPALALAWSADGSFLAVAGTGLVQIWDIRALVAMPGVGAGAEGKVRPLVTWRPERGGFGAGGARVMNGEGKRGGEEGRVLTEPSLSWSADGESLGFAVEREIAVIRFRPSLQRRDEEAETNGAS